MATDLFGNPLDEQPVAPRARVVPSVPAPVKEESAKDFSSHGAVRPYEAHKVSKTVTVVWNLPVPS